MSSTPVCAKGNTISINPLAEIRQYEPPALKENKAGTYIEFRAFDPESGKLRRKTIKLNHIKNKTERRAYAKGMIKRLNDQLSHGWNPWIAKDTADLILLDVALTLYENHIEKMHAEGLYRRETYAGYKSSLNILRKYINEEKPIYYLYQFDRKYCVDFLDYVFVTRNNKAQTHNNYLGFLRVLGGYWVDKGLLKTRPTEGIHPINKRLYAKEREVIPTKELHRITEYLRDNDPDFLSACYILYYCFIRPVEMTRLCISDFNLQESTITIPASSSKNRKRQTVTIPKKVLLHLVDRGVFSAPMTDHVFSEKLRPGTKEIDPKIFRDHWTKVRKALKLDKKWQFYSLKDSGITEMCRSNFASIAVRDQARHSSLEVTEIYTAHAGGANRDIIEHDGSL